MGSLVLPAHFFLRAGAVSRYVLLSTFQGFELRVRPGLPGLPVAPIFFWVFFTSASALRPALSTQGSVLV